MSYDIHLVRFVDGKPEPRRAESLHSLLTVAADALPDDHGYARLTWQGGEADLYGMPSSAHDELDGLMFSRPAGDPRIFDLLYQAAKLGEMVILLPDGEVCLTDPQQERHLPQDVHDWPKHFVGSGAALAAVISSDQALARRRRAPAADREPN